MNREHNDEFFSTVPWSAESIVELEGSAQDLTLLLIKDKDTENEREIERGQENKI